MLAFKSPSHEKGIFLKIRSFFSFKFFQGHNWLTNYPDSEFHGHWKTVTLSSISSNLSKHWRFLAFWLSLCFGSCLSLLPFVPLCYPVLLCVPLCYTVLPCVPLCYFVLTCVPLGYLVLPCVTLSDPVLPCVTLCDPVFPCATLTVSLCYPVFPCATLCDPVLLSVTLCYPNITPLLLAHGPIVSLSIVCDLVMWLIFETTSSISFFLSPSSETYETRKWQPSDTRRETGEAFLFPALVSRLGFAPRRSRARALPF